jgi:adhesin transport system membrane fusion protein
MSDVDFKRLSREMAGSEGIASSMIMVTIAAFVGLTIIWAAWAELDNVTRGEGRIVSSVQNQLVQAAEGYRRLSNEDQAILVAPACQYLAGLP